MERQKKWVPLYIQVLTGGIREKFDMLALKAVKLLNVARPYSAMIRRTKRKII